MIKITLQLLIDSYKRMTTGRAPGRRVWPVAFETRAAVFVPCDVSKAKLEVVYDHASS
jgi:hypothetical protein